MDTQPAFGFQQLFTYVVGDMAKAVSERNGETRQQQFARCQAATHMIMGFLPRDVIEAMLAGHCVMLHELMTDSVRDTLRGEVDTMRRATRSSIVAMDKAFAGNLARLEHYQLRPPEGQRDTLGEQPSEAGAVMPQTLAEPEQPAATPPAETAKVRAAAASETVSTAGGATVFFQPTPEVVDACRANPEAMAALDAGDGERFMRAMGIEVPSEADLAAVAPGSIFTIDPSGVRLVAASLGDLKA